jgi:hypothetical protein
MALAHVRLGTAAQAKVSGRSSPTRLPTNTQDIAELCGAAAVPPGLVQRSGVWPGLGGLHGLLRRAAGAPRQPRACCSERAVGRRVVGARDAKTNRAAAAIPPLRVLGVFCL